MTPSRLRRLRADYERTAACFASHPSIHLVVAEGTPPEKYFFEFLIPGLVPTPDGETVVSTSHRAGVFLPEDYPRRPPFCRMTTPVFHPNIDPQKICLGDHWSADQSLASLVIRIAEMICFQAYNLKSPLNAEAAVWAEKNLERLPLYRASLSAEA